MKNGMSSGKLKDCLGISLKMQILVGLFWNSYPYLVLENSKFETKTLKFGGHSPSVLTLSALTYIENKIRHYDWLLWSKKENFLLNVILDTSEHTKKFNDVRDAKIP